MSRGVSSLTAIIILVAIVAVGAISTAVFVLNTMRTLYERIQIAFDHISLIKSATKCSLKIALKNAGTKPIVSLSITIGGETYSPQIDILEPGRSVEVTLNLPAERFDVGKTYTLSIEVKASDGSKSAYAVNVMCQWGNF